MKIYGYAVIIFVLLFYSCNTLYVSQYRSTNKFVSKSPRPLFFNDSLHISMELNGDYSLDDSNNKVLKNDFKQYKRFIESYYPEIKVNRKNFVYKSTANFPPYSNTILLGFPLNHKKEVDIIDTTNYRIFYWKQDGEKQYLQIFTLNKKYDKSDFLIFKERESSVLFKTFKKGFVYKKEETPDPYSFLYDVLKDSANYLGSLLAMKSLEKKYDTQREKDFFLQAALVCSSFICNNDDYYAYQSVVYHPNDKIIESNLYDDEALDYIKNQTVGQQVVMINEQHWQPKHRDLGDRLLMDLYGKGFRYLAVEAIWENEDSLNLRKYPVQATGMYTKDPQFGNFIRNALSLGFKIISYSNVDANRELVQAQNIYNKTLKIDPNAKVFVWAGIGHILERESDHPMMASYFKKLSGINPYTIEQASGDVKASFLKEHYLAIKNDTAQGRPCDLYIYNNIKESEFRVRPGVKDKNVTITLSVKVKDELKKNKVLLLMVFNKMEFAKYRFEAVPVVNYLIKNDHAPSVNLPYGDYTIIIRNSVPSIIEQSSVIVN